jgi:cytidine deaminase
MSNPLGCILSSNPFHADPVVRTRIEALNNECGDAVRQRVAAALEVSKSDLQNNLGSILLRADAESIAAEFGLVGDELILVALKQAETFARPPISNFFVGCVGREAETGNLVFGGNLEFPGAHIGNTIHGEGFVFNRAFSRGTSISTIAVFEAHPCAHCRQFLSEFAATANLALIDPMGHRLRMADLYPWPFDPDYLGEKGIVAGEVRHPGLTLAPNDLPAPVAAKLTELGRKSYTPYGKSPAAIVLTLANGAVLGGAAIESVSFNPTISPLQAAMIDLFAHGYAASDIAAATVATSSDALVDYAGHAAGLLHAVAPGVTLGTLSWA